VSQRTRRWCVISGLTGLLLALLVFAPARWLAQAIEAASNGQVRLANSRGTVWNGQADLLLSGGEGSRGQTALPQGLTWHIAPAWSGGPALALELKAACCTPEALRMRLHPGLQSQTLRVQGFRSEWPAGLLVGLGTPWNTLQLQGQLSLVSPGLEIGFGTGRPRLQGSLAVMAMDVSTRLATLRPLGSYQLDMVADPGGESAQLKLLTQDGGLQLTGEGQWVGGRLRFRGEATAAPGSETALSNLLNIIGRREGSRSLLNIG
jgi:general secretion pathway protein N